MRAAAIDAGAQLHASQRRAPALGRLDSQEEEAVCRCTRVEQVHEGLRRIERGSCASALGLTARGPLRLTTREPNSTTARNCQRCLPLPVAFQNHSTPLSAPHLQVRCQPLGANAVRGEARLEQRGLLAIAQADPGTDQVAATGRGGGRPSVEAQAPAAAAQSGGKQDQHVDKLPHCAAGPSALPGRPPLGQQRRGLLPGVAPRPPRWPAAAQALVWPAAGLIGGNPFRPAHPGRESALTGGAAPFTPFASQVDRQTRLKRSRVKKKADGKGSTLGFSHAAALAGDSDAECCSPKDAQAVCPTGANV